MRLQRTLHQHRQKNYPKGYQAPSTALFNLERADLVLGEVSHVKLKTVSEKLPEMFDVLVQIIPITVSDKTLTAQLCLDGQLFEKTLLYQDKVALSRLDLKWLGIGTLYRGKKLKAQPFVGKTVNGFEILGKLEWTFNFISQEENIYHQPTDENQQAVWAYGGFYQPGCSLSQIAQQFFTLSGADNQTVIKVTELELWHEQGLFPPQSSTHQGRSICFHKPQDTKPYYNLAETIATGFFKCHLHMGYDEKQHHQSQEYHSIVAYQQGLDQLLIRFIKAAKQESN